MRATRTTRGEGPGRAGAATAVLAVVRERYGDPSTLRVVERELPAPAGDEVHVRVAAAGVAIVGTASKTSQDGMIQASRNRTCGSRRRTQAKGTAIAAKAAAGQ